MVRRSFTLVASAKAAPLPAQASSNSVTAGDNFVASTHPMNGADHKTVLRTIYRAKTNRMLRVAVNGFMESLGVVLGVMERLDVDVLSSSKAG
jgi:hypothetical protein